MDYRRKIIYNMVLNLEEPNIIQEPIITKLTDILHERLEYDIFPEYGYCDDVGNWTYSHFPKNDKFIEEDVYNFIYNFDFSEINLTDDDLIGIF